MKAFLDLLACRWAAAAFIGLFFWIIGWVGLRASRVHWAAAKSGILALGIIVATIWGWLQHPLFLGNRWLAIAPIFAWAVLFRILTETGEAKFRRGKRLG
jgi:hypothetical protein